MSRLTKLLGFLVISLVLIAGYIYHDKKNLTVGDCVVTNTDNYFMKQFYFEIKKVRDDGYILDNYKGNYKIKPRSPQDIILFFFFLQQNFKLVIDDNNERKVMLPNENLERFDKVDCLTHSHSGE